jgi:hypothetical protein
MWNKIKNFEFRDRFGNQCVVNWFNVILYTVVFGGVALYEFLR